MNGQHQPGSQSASVAAKQVGTDRVWINAERVVIEAAQPMDWPIREFYRVPIYFEGRKYYLRGQSDAQPPYAKRYELWPWPSDLHEATTRVVVYDETYVAQRDQAARRQRGGDRIHLLLLPIYPFLGLCWSRFKNRELAALGFEPRSITSASIMLIFGLFVVEAVLTGWLQTGILTLIFRDGWFRKLDWALMALLALDTVLRYNQSLNLDTQRHWGFCEWLWPGKRRED